MIPYKYGEFSNNQIAETKKYIRKRIFFLLLIVDPNTKDEYPEVNVGEAYDGIMREIAGLNELLFYPKEIVRVMSLLEAALMEYCNPEFSYLAYKKCVLGAGSEIAKIKEG